MSAGTLAACIRLVSQGIRDANAALEAYRQIGDQEAERLETRWREHLAKAHRELLAAGAVEAVGCSMGGGR